jgi:hypothetical protein
MAITIVGVGAVDSATPWVPTIAGPVLANDIILLLVEQIGNEANPAAATGFAHVTGSPVNVDTSTRLNVLWMRAAGGETSVTVTGPADHAVTRTITIRGVKATGDPWNVAPVTGQETALNTSAEFPTLTTLVIDCLIVFCIATGRDATTAGLGTLTGGTGLTNVTERMDNFTNVAGGGGIGMVTADKATAGSIGNAVATMASTDAKALMTIALEPAAVVAATTLWRRTSHPSYRR